MHLIKSQKDFLFLAVAHQQAATAVTSTTSTDTVEVQYNQAGPTG